MDEQHLANAVRYVSLNLVRAKLVDRAQVWRWLCVAAHIADEDDKLVATAPMLERYGDFTAFLGHEQDDEPAITSLRQSETTGRPLASNSWLEALEKKPENGSNLKNEVQNPNERQ